MTNLTKFTNHLANCAKSKVLVCRSLLNNKKTKRKIMVENMVHSAAPIIVQLVMLSVASFLRATTASKHRWTKGVGSFW